MEINNIMNDSMSSVKSALSTVMLRKSMSQDSQAMASLIDGMEKANQKILEASVTPHKGGKIDIST